VKKRYATNIAAVNPARSTSNLQPIEYLVFFIPGEISKPVEAMLMD
jgi:hypothetical protein